VPAHQAGVSYVIAGEARADHGAPGRASQSGGYANHLSQWSDPKHHPFASDRCLLGPATVLMGQLVDVLPRLRPPQSLRVAAG
jgi:hypothetical protein